MLTDRPKIVRDLISSDATFATRRFTCEVPINTAIFFLFYTVIGLHFDTTSIDVARTSVAQNMSDLKGCPKIL